jgi:hypothetical protein
MTEDGDDARGYRNPATRCQSLVTNALEAKRMEISDRVQ